MGGTGGTGTSDVGVRGVSLEDESAGRGISPRSSQESRGDPLFKLVALALAESFFFGGGVAVLAALAFDFGVNPSSLRSASAVSGSTFCIESDCFNERLKYEFEGLMAGGVRLFTDVEPRRN